MKRMSIPFFLWATLLSMVLAAAVVYGHGVAELNEGKFRKLYVDKPLIGATGIIVGDWHGGQVRVEVHKFPASSTGYEVFLVNLNLPMFGSKMLVGGKPGQAMVANPPPFSEVAKAVRGWKSIGDLEMDGSGNGKLKYTGGENLFEQGFNNVMVFEKVSAGPHEGPEDFSKLIIECNGPLPGTQESAGWDLGIKVF